MNKNIIFNIEHLQYLLGITSIWLLLPAIKCINYDNIWKMIILINSVAASIISIITWSSINKLFLLIDKILAQILFINLLLYYYFILSYPSYVNIILSFFVISFYSTSKYYNKKNNLFLDSIFHMLFRYIGFWWSYIAFIQPNLDFNFLVILIGYSGIYFGHIIYSIQWIIYDKDFKLSKYYLKGCSEIVFLILILLLM